MKKNIMKKRGWLWCLLLPLVLIACGDDETNDYSDPDTDYDPDAEVCDILISGRLSGYATRADGGNTLGGKWNADDAISLLMQPKGGSISAVTYKIDPASVTNDGTTATFKGTQKWGEANQSYTFYGFYPALGSVSDPENIPMEVPAEQVQNGRSDTHLLPLDQLVAAPVITSSPGLINDPALNKPVQFQFSHLFALHEFRFAVKGTGTKLKIRSVTLSDEHGTPLALTGASLDLTTYASNERFGELTGGTGIEQIVVNVENSGYIPTTMSNGISTNPAQPAPTTVFPVWLISLPGDFSPAAEEELNMKLLVAVTVDTVDPETGQVTASEDTEFEMEYAGDHFRRGYKYVSDWVIAGIGGGTHPGMPWDGTSKKPVITDKTIEIAEPAELAWIAKIVNKVETDDDIEDPTFAGYTLKVTKNLNLADEEWTPIGISSSIFFSGTLDGMDNTVSGLNISNYDFTSTNRGAGLFGSIKSGTVRNLKVNGTIQAESTVTGPYAGGIVGMTNGSAASPALIENCTYSGAISITAATTTYVAGIVGYPSSTNIKNCVNLAEITATNNSPQYTSFFGIGGIAGYGSITISDCFNAGNINTLSGSIRAGGIIGQMGGGNLYGSANAGNIRAAGSGSVIGGVAAYMSGSMLACYNQGSIELTGSIVHSSSAYYSVGGVIGAAASNKVIKGCYNTGEIKPGTYANNMEGNIVGRYYIAFGTYNYNQIQNNYYSPAALPSDNNENVTKDNRITRFSATAWPTSGMEGWETGTGEDNKYWKSLGKHNQEYPKLWWE